MLEAKDIGESVFKKKKTLQKKKEKKLGLPKNFLLVLELRSRGFYIQPMPMI